MRQEKTEQTQRQARRAPRAVSQREKAEQAQGFPFEMPQRKFVQALPREEREEREAPSVPERTQALPQAGPQREKSGQVRHFSPSAEGQPARSAPAKLSQAEPWEGTSF